MDFVRGRLAGVNWPVFRGDEDAAELGDHVAVDGSALVLYQGARAGAPRRRGGPGGGVPEDGDAWQARVNGMVRCTAVASRLRACPAPKICLASSTATSMV